MAINDLRADSARDNPAPADEFTTAFLDAFANWRLHDDPEPDQHPSGADCRRAEWLYEGARSKAVSEPPESAAHAAIVALIAYDEAETLLHNSSLVSSTRLAHHEIDALRLILDSLRSLWSYLDERGGGAAWPLADHHGLKSVQAPKGGNA